MNSCIDRRRRATRLGVTAALAALLAAGSAHAGAWTQAPGHYYAKISGIAYHADEVYDGMGGRQEMGINDDRFSGRQAFLYVEYGLREALTLVTQARLGVLTAEDDFVRMETTGIGDLEAGLKLRLVQRPVVVSPMLSLKLPTGYDDGFDPPLGTGHVDGEARLLVSRSLYPLPLYLHGEGGYRVRGGPFSNQRFWAAEVGATPHRRLFAKLYLADTNTLSSRSDADLGLVGVSAQVSEGDCTNLGVNAAVEVVPGLWLDGLFERAVRGQNIGAGRSFGLGLSVSR